MPDIPKITTPLTGYENANKPTNVSINDTKIQNIVNPNKIVRPDGQNVNTDNNDDSRFLADYKSNFDNFVELLKNSPSITEEFTQYMFLKMKAVVSSGIGDSFSKEMVDFINSMKMDEAEFLNFFKNQTVSAQKFNGVFFDILRKALSSGSIKELNGDIINFLKVYNDNTSNMHIFKNIISTLDNIKNNMPNSYAAKLNEIIEKLDIGGKFFAKDNLNILKNEIIPFLSQYIGKTHDMGMVRDFISLLTLNIVRYENGIDENYEKALRGLLEHQGIKEKLSSVGSEQLKSILFSGEKINNTDALSKMLDIIQKGIRGEAGYENKAVFEEVIRSMLVNESVYMPLMHLMFPVEINGRKMFSELWVDPDAENNNNISEQKGKNVKIFIKFDIMDLGYFELIIMSNENKLDMQLYYPEKLVPLEKEIKESVSKIAENNNFSFNSFILDKCSRKKTVSEVFPKIFERKDYINVKI